MFRRFWPIFVLVLTLGIGAAATASSRQSPTIRVVPASADVTGQVFSGDPEHLVNLRDAPSPPPEGTVTIWWWILDRIPDGTRVIVRCRTHGYVPPSSPTRHDDWLYVNEGPDGPRPGTSGYVYADLVSGTGPVPACSDEIINRHAAPVPPYTPQPGPPARADQRFITMARGTAAPHGYWYVMDLAGFEPHSDVTVGCFDSSAPNVPFRVFTLRTDDSGRAHSAYDCFSGDGPEHWAVADELLGSDTVRWDSTPQVGDGQVSPPGAPPVPTPVAEPEQPTFTVMNTSETPPDGVWFRNSARTGDTERITGLGVYMAERVRLECYAFGDSVGRFDDRLWYRTTNVTRPRVNGRANTGYLNAHYIDDHQNANVIDAGVPPC